MGVLAFTFPIFRSGIKVNLTLVEFILNHTIFCKDPEYIPKEDYEAIFDECRDTFKDRL